MAGAITTRHAPAGARDAAPSGVTSAGRRRFFTLSLVAVFATYALIVAGATVRVTGSGLGCPDWPTCHGRLVPPLDAAAIIEYVHRLLGAIVSPLIVALPVAAWLWCRERRILAPAIALPFLLALQIALGAIVVALELPPMVVLVHLGFAMLIFGGLVWTAASAAPVWQASPAEADSPASSRAAHLWLAGFTAAFVFLVVLSGAYTRASGASWACTGFPGCEPPVEALAAAGGPGLVHVHLFHRSMAYAGTGLALATGCVAWMRGRQRPALRWAAVLLAGSMLAQAGIGVAAVVLGLPAVLRGAHVAGAAAAWGSSVLVIALMLRLDRPAAHRDEALRQGDAPPVRTAAAASA